jgi:hypothetical protein
LFLTDPALCRIAAATADVLPDLMWRFDTADPGPRGALAQLLHDTSLRFTDSHRQLNQALDKCAKDIDRLQRELAKDAHVHHAGTDRLFTNTLAAIARHTVLEQQLISQYTAWRTLAPAPQLDFNLLIRAGDPTWGVAEMRHVDLSHWHVVPDAEAACRFNLAGHAGRMVGDVTITEGGFQPTAYLQPEYLLLHHELVYQLPLCEDPQAAVRSLLRWWAYRESDAWDGRTPAELTPDELTALAE